MRSNIITNSKPDDSLGILPVPPPCDICLPYVKILRNVVLNVLSGLQSQEVCSPDGDTPIALKQYASALALYLAEPLNYVYLYPHFLLL